MKDTPALGATGAWALQHPFEAERVQCVRLSLSARQHSDVYRAFALTDLGNLVKRLVFFLFFSPSDAKFKPAAKHAPAQPKTPAEGARSVGLFFLGTARFSHTSVRSQRRGCANCALGRIPRPVSPPPYEWGLAAALAVPERCHRGASGARAFIQPSLLRRRRFLGAFRPCALFAGSHTRPARPPEASSAGPPEAYICLGGS
jgi:hypothetical protein